MGVVRAVTETSALEKRRFQITKFQRTCSTAYNEMLFPLSHDNRWGEEFERKFEQPPPIDSMRSRSVERQKRATRIRGWVRRRRHTPLGWIMSKSILKID